MPWTEHGNYYHYEEYLSETEEDLTQYIEANKKPTKKEWNAILLSAVADADFQTVHRLRRRGASVNAKDQEGRSALWIACRNCDGKMVKYLLKWGARPTGAQDVLACVLDNTDSCTSGRLAVLEALLKTGAKAQRQSLQLLLHACKQPEELALLKMLLRLKTSTTVKANGGKCPLVKACEHDNWQAAELLLRHGVQVNSADSQGWTPLMHASCAGDTKLVKLLLKRNAKTHLCNSQGNQALDLSGCDNITKLLQPKIKAVPVTKVPRGKPTRVTDCSVNLAAFLEPAKDWAESQVALQTRLANLQLQHVAVFDSECEGGLQQQAYLGNNEQLLQHMRDRGTISMTTKSVRNWLEKHGGFPLGYENANLCLADCDIDHILPNSVGGQNHPYNYVLLPKRLNGSFNGWWTAQKQVYIGKKTARTAKNFFIWVREEGSRLGLDCNDFHQKRYSM